MPLSDVLSSPQLYDLSQLLSRGRCYAQDFLGKYVEPQPGDRILDIGCGTGLKLKYLLKYFSDIKVEYIGFDMSESYISAAKKSFGAKGTFLCEELTAESVVNFGLFDKVIAAGVVHHLDDLQSENLFRIAHKALKPHGRLVTLDGCYFPENMKQSRLVTIQFENDRGKYIRYQDEYEKLAKKNFTKIITEIREDLFMIPYTNLIMVCEKNNDTKCQ